MLLRFRRRLGWGYRSLYMRLQLRWYARDHRCRGTDMLKMYLFFQTTSTTIRAPSPRHIGTSQASASTSPDVPQSLANATLRDPRVPLAATLENFRIFSARHHSLSFHGVHGLDFTLSFRSFRPGEYRLSYFIHTKGVRSFLALATHCDYFYYYHIPLFRVVVITKLLRSWLGRARYST